MTKLRGSDAGSGDLPDEQVREGASKQGDKTFAPAPERDEERVPPVEPDEEQAGIAAGAEQPDEDYEEEEAEYPDEEYTDEEYTDEYYEDEPVEEGEYSEGEYPEEDYAEDEYAEDEYAEGGEEGEYEEYPDEEYQDEEYVEEALETGEEEAAPAPQKKPFLTKIDLIFLAIGIIFGLLTSRSCK